MEECWSDRNNGSTGDSLDLAGGIRGREFRREEDEGAKLTSISLEHENHAASGSYLVSFGYLTLGIEMKI